MATLTRKMIFSVVLLLLLLQLVTAVPIPINAICAKTREFRRCVTILEGFDKRSSTAALPVLEQIIIKAATVRTRQIYSDFDFLDRHTGGIPYYRDCRDLYINAYTALENSEQYLQHRNYAKLVEVAGILGQTVTDCKWSLLFRLKKLDKLRNANEDIGVLANAIAAFAKNHI